MRHLVIFSVFIVERRRTQRQRRAAPRDAAWVRTRGQGALQRGYIAAAAAASPHHHCILQWKNGYQTH